ncbi:hypothetical protein VTK56DRAFT_2305 [Thermocarpiscus australiensis]
MPLSNYPRDPLGGIISYDEIITNCYKLEKTSLSIGEMLQMPHPNELRLRYDKEGKYRAINWTRRYNCEAALI